MKFLISGGTGFLGSALRAGLTEAGHTITCLSRSRSGSEGSTTFVAIETLQTLPTHDAVINLAGESVAGLWTPGKRRRIYESRVETTHQISDWISRQSEKPRVFLSGSAVGIYGDGGSTELTETTDISRAEGFLARVTRDWEYAASASSWQGVRTIHLRTGQVLDPQGGYLAKVLPLMRRFPIVLLGPGESYFPWIALEDWIGIVMHALADESIQGPLNLTNPNPVTQYDFTTAMAAKLGKRVWARIPKWLLKAAAGDFGVAITYSQRVLPVQAADSGYRFRFPTLASYLASIP